VGAGLFYADGPTAEKQIWRSC